jgi:hypothetical protein
VLKDLGRRAVPVHLATAPAFQSPLLRPLEHVDAVGHRGNRIVPQP